jgi:O-antigen/teichoic acid export membrane protein
LKSQVSFYLEEIKNVGSKGFFHLFTAQGFIIIVGFVSQLFVAGFLDPTDIGRIKIMQTFISLSTLICGLGFNTSLLKLASENRTDEEKKQLYQTAFLITLISFVVIYLVLYLLSFFGMVSTDPVISNIFPVYALFLLPLSLQSIQLAYYQALKQIKKMAKLQFIVKVISILFIVIFTYLFKLNGYIMTMVSTGFLAIIIFEIGIKNVIFNASYFKLNFNLLKSMWHFAGYALITNVVGALAATVDVYLINYLITDRKEVGYYMFALTILSVYQLFPTTIQQIAFPFFSEQSSSYAVWHSSYKKYNKLNHILIFFVVLGGVLILPVLIKLAFSGKYNRSIHYFLLFSIAWMIKNSNIMKGTAIMGQGRFDLNFLGSLITLLLTIPVVFISIKIYGLNGAVMGMIAGAIIAYITNSLIFRSFNKKLINGF